MGTTTFGGYAREDVGRDSIAQFVLVAVRGRKRHARRDWGRSDEPVVSTTQYKRTHTGQTRHKTLRARLSSTSETARIIVFVFFPSTSRRFQRTSHGDDSIAKTVFVGAA